MVEGWALIKVSKSKVVKPVDVDDYGSVAGKHYNKGEAPEFIFWDCLRKSQTNSSFFFRFVKASLQIFSHKIFDVEVHKKTPIVQILEPGYA